VKIRIIGTEQECEVAAEGRIAEPGSPRGSPPASTRQDSSGLAGIGTWP